MNVETVNKEVGKIWEILQSPYDDNPEIIKIRMQELTSFYTWVNKHLVDAKYYHSMACKLELEQFLKDAQSGNMSKTLQNKYAECLCPETAKLVTDLDGLKSALFRDIETSRSLLSYAKEEMYISRSQSH